MHDQDIKNNVCLHSVQYCPLSHTIIDMVCEHKLYVFVILSMCDHDDMFKNARQEAERQFKSNII